MAADPEPKNAGLDCCAQGTLLKPDADRPETVYRFEMQSWVAQIRLERAVRSSCEPDPEPGAAVHERWPRIRGLSDTSKLSCLALVPGLNGCVGQFVGRQVADLVFDLFDGALDFALFRVTGYGLRVAGYKKSGVGDPWVFSQALSSRGLACRRGGIQPLCSVSARNRVQLVARRPK